MTAIEQGHLEGNPGYEQRRLREGLQVLCDRLERCDSERVGKKSVRRENTIQGYAEKCYEILHGLD